MLTRGAISSKVDDSSVTVGKRYARTDECGIPFAVTVDEVTITDDTVTIRELHTMKQIRVPTADLVTLFTELTTGLSDWEAAVQKYGLFEHVAAE